MWFSQDTEREARILIFIHGFANSILGMSLLLWANVGAEGVLSGLGLPSWLFPSLFIAAGLGGFIGVFSRNTARFAFVFAAIVTSVFGFASLYSVIGGNLAAMPTTVFLLYITVLKLAVSRMIRERDDIVEQVTAATERGQTALDRATNGTTT